MIWERCGPDAVIEPLGGSLWRFVESQEQVATLGLVDTLDEQALLEEMLEATKPPAPAGRLHYLLSTPFRYPPLRYGSRFGGRHEPGIFYGSLSVETVLAESAYYRFVFWEGMETPPSERLISQHTLFSTSYGTDRGVRLQSPPFEPCKGALVDPADYGATQRLGTRLREEGVEAFEFPSARAAGEGVNVGLFVPHALVDGQIASTQQWLCETHADRVSFSCLTEHRTAAFPKASFLVGGRLPAPAC